MSHIEKSHDLLKQIETKEMDLVIIETPFASPDIEVFALNMKYARLCVRDCLFHNEAAYASHLFYTQEGVLNDGIPEERALGIHAGLLWGNKATKTIVYTDLGISAGMERGIERARKEGRSIEFRTLGYIPNVTLAEVELEKMKRAVAKQELAEVKSIDHLLSV